MIKRLLATLAVVELLVPERVIVFGERLSLENPGECSLRSWVPLVARLEGLVVLAALVRPGALSGLVRSVLGWYGLLAVLSPEGYLEYWTDLVYEDAERLDWKPWVVPMTRAIGACYVVIALFGWGSKDGRRND
ncbi:hypothetical protein [Halalkalicoccus jeotgali]|uniref:Uncharacterized protein n=1 Tax=Halalkalicoccus jeotgali (strain DSM 18796 / CECT 7217 / JCM 14584 / KCTC 4019 / B3) TaxID=795797 RepID=D8J7Y9_HALJB|nr:hypothetical protein [Halalkalicoccus jeotgali]ADJ14102.1 hypothetical protein HacjB3_03555 [Halalkalicoccus jeotgali B3]ELY34716.1 hypothetical protein C497_15738 [Halalkalicoccus jeotgali B3]